MNKNQGIAVVTVLLIIAFITTSIAILLNKQNSLVENTRILKNQDLAFNYFLSAKSLVVDQLLKDKNLNYDGDDEDWFTFINEDFAVIPIDGLLIQNKITPLNSKININNIIIIERDQVEKRRMPNFNTCLFKLANKLEMIPFDDSIINYINNKEKKSLISNINELKDRVFNTEDYYKIRPYIYASGEVVAKVNINTANEDILECLHYDLNDFNVAEIIKARPFKSVKEAEIALIKQMPHLSPASINEYFKDLIDVKSTYFLFESSIRVDDDVFIAKAILKRDGGKVSTVSQELNYNIK